MSKIRALLRAVAWPDPPEENVEDAVEPSEPEAEVPEDLVKVCPPEYVIPGVSSLNAGHAEAVVLGSLLVVGEDGVGL